MATGYGGVISWWNRNLVVVQWCVTRVRHGAGALAHNTIHTIVEQCRHCAVIKYYKGLSKTSLLLDEKNDSVVIIISIFCIL